jgi:hypothetical protein
MPFVAGSITRSNLPTPLSPLVLQANPYWVLMGDADDKADVSTQNGFVPGLSAHKQTWADSPYVSGKQLVLSTPDNSTLVLRMLVEDTSQLAMQNDIVALVTAVSEQLVYEVNLTFDSASYTYVCYSGDYQMALGGQLSQFAFWCPLYLILPRDPAVLTTEGSFT